MDEEEKGAFRGEEREYLRGELIVKVEPEAIAGDKAGFERIVTEALGSKDAFSILTSADDRGIGLIEIGAESDLEETADRLETHDAVVFAEPNPVQRTSQGDPEPQKDVPSVDPGDPLFERQWHLQTVNAPAAWSLTTGSSNVVIGVMDTGIPMGGNPPRLSHEDLNDPARFFPGGNFVSPGSQPLDDHGHGTHVAGIAAAETGNGRGIAGVAWRPLVHVTKVFDRAGRGSGMNVYNAARDSIAFAAGRGSRLVLNYSGGGSGYARIYEETAQVVRDADALLCAAAGNDNGGPVGYPAAMSTRSDGSDWYPNVVAVAATNQGDERASFSNRGVQVNVAAPGVDILSTMPDYRVTLNEPPANKNLNYDELSGTSMATPIVAGVAALVWSREPGLTAVQVRDRLQLSAVDLPPGGRDVSFGFGRVDAYRALRPGPIQPPEPSINRAPHLNLGLNVGWLAQGLRPPRRLDWMMSGDLDRILATAPRGGYRQFESFVSQARGFLQQRRYAEMGGSIAALGSFFQGQVTGDENLVKASALALGIVLGWLQQGSDARSQPAGEMLGYSPGLPPGNFEYVKVHARNAGFTGAGSLMDQARNILLADPNRDVRRVLETVTATIRLMQDQSAAPYP